MRGGVPVASATVAAHECIDRAEELALGRPHLRQWASGSHVEAAWSALHVAEERLAAGVGADAAHVRPLAQDAIDHARRNLPADHALLTALTAELAAERHDWAEIRQLSVEVLAAAHEAGDQLHQEQRELRNRLAATVVLLGGLAVATVAVIFALPHHGPATLLPKPPGINTGTAVLVAMLMGLVGAMFSAIPSLAQVPKSVSPFNPIQEQAALKLVVGAWSAVIGLMVVGAGMGDAGQLTHATNLAGFAIMSAMFGASQEALTRFADAKAAGS